MQERLIVKNFGPLKDIDIELKDVMVFIGPQATGKSTLAKLIAIFQDRDFLHNLEKVKAEKQINIFKDYLNRYNINHNILSSTKISFYTENGIITLEKKALRVSKNYSFTMESHSELFDDLNLLDNHLNKILNSNKKEIDSKDFKLNILKEISLIISFLSNEIKNNRKELKKIESLTHNQKAFKEIDSQTQIIDNLIAKINKYDQLLKKTESFYSFFIKQLSKALENTEIKNSKNFSINLEIPDERLIELSEIIKSSKQVLEHSKESFYHVLYIPAERIILPTTSGAFYTLGKIDVPLPKSILDFGSLFEKARNKEEGYEIKILDVRYKFSEKEDKVYLSPKKSIKLSQTSSGMQALIPMLVVIEHFNDQNTFNKATFILEEPEISCYPNTQKDLVEFLVGKCTRNGNQLIITTHSPYILSSLDNLVQASNVANDKPEEVEKIKQIVPEELWLDYDNVSAYFIDKGKAKDIRDEEYKSIGPNKIDDISTQLGETFDELLDIRYN